MRVAGLLALAALTTACGARERGTSSTSSFVVEVSGGAPSAMDLPGPDFSGLRVEVASGVRYRHSRVSSDGEAHTETTLNGLPFEVRERSLFIGDQSYGPFEGGAHVRITPQGVFVGETNHGALPES